MHNVLVVTDSQTQTEALYINGELSFETETIYASEIAEAVEHEPCIYSHKSATITGDFPEKAKDLVIDE